MSATMAANMYQTYFNVPEPPIQVGFKRFRIKEYFIEDIIEKLDLPLEEVTALEQICAAMQGKATPSTPIMDKLCESAASLATIVGKPGSSVLIFVSGMFDIMR